MSNGNEHGVSTAAGSVLLDWRDRLDHEIAALRQLESEFDGMSQAGESIGPEGVEACADLLKNIGGELMRLRMSIHGLSSDAGEHDQDDIH